jgi:CheY-like chemotaxis protein
MANILVADDSPVVRTWLAKLLPAMGHAVAGTAPNGMEPCAWPPPCAPIWCSWTSACPAIWTV